MVWSLLKAAKGVWMSDVVQCLIAGAQLKANL